MATKKFERGLCARCGASGHLQFDCPYLPARPPTNRPAPPKLNKVQTNSQLKLEDDDKSESEDSGKRITPGESRTPGVEQELKKEWQEQAENMVSPLPVCNVLIDNVEFVPALLDSGCAMYALVSQNVADRLQLRRIRYGL